MQCGMFKKKKKIKKKKKKKKLPDIRALNYRMYESRNAKTNIYKFCMTDCIGLNNLTTN
jgi:hypothetical protein